VLASDAMQTDNVLSCDLRSWHCRSSILSYRLRSAVAAVDLLISKKRQDEAADLAVDDINLLPLASRRILS
jgi:hypothetical protein